MPLKCSRFALSCCCGGGDGYGDIRQGDIPNLDILVCPLVEELDAANLCGDILGEDLVAGLRDLNFDIAGFRHDCYVGVINWEMFVVGRAKSGRRRR